MAASSSRDPWTTDGTGEPEGAAEPQSRDAHTQPVPETPHLADESFTIPANLLSTGQLAVLILHYEEQGELLDALHGWCTHREFGVHCQRDGWEATLARTCQALTLRLHPDKNNGPEARPTNMRLGMLAWPSGEREAL